MHHYDCSTHFRRIDLAAQFLQREDGRVFIAVVAGDERQDGAPMRAAHGGYRDLRAGVEDRRGICTSANAFSSTGPTYTISPSQRPSSCSWPTPRSTPCRR